MCATSRHEACKQIESFATPITPHGLCPCPTGQTPKPLQVCLILGDNIDRNKCGVTIELAMLVVIRAIVASHRVMPATPELL